ncbi:MAG: BatA domain-containing protein [Planctomycetaceae bacterium]
MTFLNLFFLWGLPLLSVPVAIHLLSRRRQAVVKWGAMQFLTTSSIRRRKIWRVDDLLLMLLRTLSVLALVMALARPLWQGWGTRGGSGRDIVLVCDVSMSMGRSWQGETSFDHLLKQAESLLARAGAGDTIRGMVTIGRGEWLTSDPVTANAENKLQLLESLKNIGTTESSADWHSCLNRAIHLAAPAGASARLIVVLTDGQAEGWQQDDPPGWKKLLQTASESGIATAIEIYNVNDQSFAASNLAVDQLSAPRQLLAVGEPCVLEAEVRNYGPITVPPCSLIWSMEGTDIGSSSIGPLAAGQSAKVNLRINAGQPGISRVTGRIDLADDLPADNSRSLLLTTVDHVPLLLVDDSTSDDPLTTDRGYLLSALGLERTGEKNAHRESVFQVRVITSTELEQESLSKYRAIVFPNTPTLKSDLVEKLTAFVRNGGGLWLGLGDQTQPDEFNRQLFRLGSGIAPWPIKEAQGDLIRREDSLTIHPPEKEHPATSLLSDTQRLDIDRAKIFRRYPFASARSSRQVPVLLRSGTGEALAVEGTLGQGRFIVQSFPLGTRWSSLPLTQAYVPMVHEWLWYLMQPSAVPLNLMPGEPIHVELSSNEHIRSVQLQRPGGQPIPLTTYLQGDQVVAQSRRTQLPGRYDVVIQIEGKPDEIRPYQVMRAREESNLTPWSPQLTEVWKGSPVVRLSPAQPLVMPASSNPQVTGSPLWRLLLFVVVAAIVAELGMVAWIARKRFGFRSDLAPAGSVAPQTAGASFGIRETP